MRDRTAADFARDVGPVIKEQGPGRICRPEAAEEHLVLDRSRGATRRNELVGVVNARVDHAHLHAIQVRQSRIVRIRPEHGPHGRGVDQGHRDVHGGLVQPARRDLDHIGPAPQAVNRFAVELNGDSVENDRVFLQDFDLSRVGMQPRVEVLMNVGDVTAVCAGGVGTQIEFVSRCRLRGGETRDVACVVSDRLRIELDDGEVGRAQLIGATGTVSSRRRHRGRHHQNHENPQDQRTRSDMTAYRTTPSSILNRRCKSIVRRRERPMGAKR